jgi:TonB family protein
MIVACSTMAPKPAPAPTPTPTTPTTTASTSTGTGTDQKAPPPSGPAFDALLKLADFKNVPFATFEFTDTSKETAPKQSFGMVSERANQKIYFVVWPNSNTTEAVESNAVQPPYVPLHKFDETVGAGRNIAKGTSPMHDFYWKAVRCTNADNKLTVALIGAFSASDNAQSILVVAMPFKGEGDIDFKNTVSVVERMFNEGGGSGQPTTAGSTGSTPTAAGAASAEDVTAYRQKVGEMIKASYKAPPDSDRANKCVVNFTIDATGNIRGVELKYSSSMDEVDKAVQKAIAAKVPYPAPPGTQSGQVPMQVTLSNGEFSFDEP